MYKVSRSHGYPDGRGPESSAPLKPDLVRPSRRHMKVSVRAAECAIRQSRLRPVASWANTAHVSTRVDTSDFTNVDVFSREKECVCIARFTYDMNDINIYMFPCPSYNS